MIAPRPDATRTLAALFAACYLARLPVTAISLGIVLAVRESGGAYASPVSPPARSRSASR